MDSRSSKKASWTKAFHGSKINSIQQSPLDEHIILSASSGVNGHMSVHDLRMVGKPKFDSLKDFKGHSKSINAAYYTGDGEHIVSVSQDNHVFVWHKFMEKSPSISKLYHDNHTGRWLSTFKPVFDPKSPNSFLLGSMDKVRKMEIYIVNPKTHSLDKQPIKLEGVNSVQSRNAFHPKLNVVAGGNSSGRVSVYF
jgi:WD repeat-containing protein 76